MMGEDPVADIEEHDKDDESSVDSFTNTQFPVDAIRANEHNIINNRPQLLSLFQEQAYHHSGHDENILVVVK